MNLVIAGWCLDLSVDTLHGFIASFVIGSRGNEQACGHSYGGYFTNIENLPALALVRLAAASGLECSQFPNTISINTISMRLYGSSVAMVM